MKNDILKPTKAISFPKINLDGVKGVLIDLDNTLYHYRPPHEKAMQAVHRFLCKIYPMPKDVFEKDFERVWDKIYEELGNIPIAHNRALIFQRFAEEKGIRKPYEFGLKADTIYFKKVFTWMRRLGPDKNAVSFLKECKKKALPVCLVTDLFATIQTKKLKALKLTDYVDFIVANDEVGFDKPNAKMFTKALEKIGLSEKDVIMIGDHPVKDIQGAQKIGIRTHQVELLK